MLFRSTPVKFSSPVPISAACRWSIRGGGQAVRDNEISVPQKLAQFFEIDAAQFEVGRLFISFSGTGKYLPSHFADPVDIFLHIAGQQIKFVIHDHRIDIVIFQCQAQAGANAVVEKPIGDQDIDFEGFHRTTYLPHSARIAPRKAWVRICLQLIAAIPEAFPDNKNFIEFFILL